MVDPQATKRLRWLISGAVLWAAIIAGRLVHLQIFQHAELKAVARQQQTRTEEIQAARGAISDRNGQMLAISMPVDSVHINPLRIPDLTVAADILSPVLSLDRSVLLDRMRKAVSRRTGFLWVKRKVTPAESARLRALKLDWIGFQKESRRFYPNGTLAAHVLGGVGMVRKEDTQERGNAGIEMALDEELRGTNGKLILLTDVTRQAFAIDDEVKPLPGVNLTLSLDSRIQYLAERELARAVASSRARTGSVVVMDPRTGEILALASYPAYDPNEPPAPGENPVARHNVPVSYASEPGSVFKAFTIAAALETTRLRPESILNCGNGTIQLFGRTIHDHHAYAALSMADVLAKSSNVGVIRVGLAVGEQRLHEYVSRFGFGQASGLPLPAESAGILRPTRKWGRTSIGSIAMGHEVSTTTVQLARACSAIANGGTLVKPRLVLKREKPGSAPEFTASGAGEQILQPETAITMRQMMERVVLSGTGKAATLRGYTSGGKTGSAQIFDLATKKYTHTYNASFMGFAPVTNPAIVVVVTLNGTSGGSAGFGGAVAAPVFREVASGALRILDTPKDIPIELSQAPVKEVAKADLNDLPLAEISRGVDAESPGETAVSSVTQPPVRPEEGASAPAAGPDRRIFSETAGPRVPDFQGMTMRSVLEVASARGVAVEMSGNGLVRAQDPPPGSALSPGRAVRILLSR
ncbi:MAG: transpeptidase family protein [Bryobacteraceae bacterium]|nr:transpeptidase family protein [Bryobacteraceae bacterium]